MELEVWLRWWNTCFSSAKSWVQTESHKIYMDEFKTGSNKFKILTSHIKIPNTKTSELILYNRI
jgi:hypothetical protein